MSVIVFSFQVEVFEISAPLDAPNFLTIGPIFQQFSHLEELHIVRSNIPAIGKHSFWGVPTLKILNLTQNNISHVLEHNFRGLVNLVKLHLDDNRIESMPSETFKHLQELKVLTLARNKIYELVPRIFLMLGKLHELDLSQNPLEDLNPEVFKDVQGLRVFRCRLCRLSNINILIYRLLGDLIELDLGENEFKYVLPDEFYYLRKLQVLKFDANQLAVVMDNTFGNGGTDLNLYPTEHRMNLQVVNLSRNRLAKVTLHAFSNLTTLRVLDLSYNKFDKMEPRIFLPLADSLQTLNLSGNAIPISELKIIIQIVSKLNHLSLADMELSNLPTGFFAHQENLKFLNLSGNRFSHISFHVMTFVTRIQTLDFSRNRFRGLNEKVVTRLEKIPNLILKENPWACDLCHIPPILNRVNKSKLSVALRELTCKSPYSLAGRNVFTLQGSELWWCTSGEALNNDENISAVGASRSLLPGKIPLGLIISLGAFILLIMLGVTVVVCVAYSRRRTNHYYTREEQRSQYESIFENSTTVNDESDKGIYKESFEIQKIKKKKVSIATIDEIVKYPELYVSTNNT